MQALDAERRIGVIGATSAAGAYLLPDLVAAGYRVTAFTRGALPRPGPPEASAGPGSLSWHPLPAAGAPRLGGLAPLPRLVCLARIEHLPAHFGLLEHLGVRRLVALSSTSLLTKSGATDRAERELAERLASAEAQLGDWAVRHGVAWTVLRPTLAYGGGRDRNIAAMAGVIRRLGFFPLLGRASGLRQPIHFADVAAACRQALEAGAAENRAYNISGGEVLSYRDMAARVFAAMGRSPRLVAIPSAVIKGAIGAARMLPRFRHWTPGMAERMQLDMVFDHGEAARDFGFAPRAFVLTAADVAPRPAAAAGPVRPPPPPKG